MSCAIAFSGTTGAAASGASATCTQPTKIIIDSSGNATGDTAYFHIHETRIYVTTPHFDLIDIAPINSSAVYGDSGKDSDGTIWTGAKEPDGGYGHQPKQGQYIASAVATGCKTDVGPAPSPSSTAPTSTAPTPVAAPRHRTVHRGGQETISASGFAPHERVTAVLHSTAHTLGTFTATSAGTVTFTFTVPADIAAGRHTVTLTGATSQRVAHASFTVTTAATSATPTSPTTSTAPIASTGATHLGGLIWTAVAALLAGTGLLAGARRRNRPQHSA